jgi:hypothetical protein
LKLFLISIFLDISQASRFDRQEDGILIVFAELYNRAPQHPTSHLLHSIPPRSASRSSRSNILSYTLHLSTTSRLTTYASSSGGAALLSRAEAGGAVRKSETEEWAEEEEKSRGLRKLSLSLLSASRLSGPLPPTVERRVILARLTEDLLVSPLPPTQFVSSTPSASATPTPAAPIQITIRPSSQIPSLIALAPLTSPDTTTTYSLANSAARATSSIAQSLIELKFGNSRDAEREGAIVTDDNGKDPNAPIPHRLSASANLNVPASSVFAQNQSRAGRESEARGIVEAPHIDYRIVRGHAMRSRAKEIFSHSILSLSTPTPTSTSVSTPIASTLDRWCRRHRVQACGICLPAIIATETLSTSTSTLSASTPTKKRIITSFPGQGLVGVLTPTGARRPLAEIIPTFLIFSSTLLADLRERSDKSSTPSSQYSSAVSVTSSWYSLLHSLAIQACLEGYLVDGWTGTEAIEVLFGCGCGVWEGKGWASRAALGVPSKKTLSKRQQQKQRFSSAAVEVGTAEESEEDYSDTDSEEEELRKLERGQEVEKRELVEAAQLLFGSRDQAQAEFERDMRDRIHEVSYLIIFCLRLIKSTEFRLAQNNKQFLNVPSDQTLQSHLKSLNAKYPLSGFETDVVDFLGSTSRFLGKPSLARVSFPSLCRVDVGLMIYQRFSMNLL